MKQRYIIGMNNDDKTGAIFLCSVPVDENNLGKQIMTFPERKIGDMATIVGYANSGITAIEGEDGGPRDLGAIVGSGEESGTFAMNKDGVVKKVGPMSDEEIRSMFKSDQKKADADDTDVNAYIWKEPTDTVQSAIAARFPMANEVRNICEKIADVLKDEVTAGNITSTDQVDNAIAMMLGRILSNAKTEEARKRLLMIVDAGEVSYRLSKNDMSPMTIKLMNRVLKDAGIG